MQKRSKYKIWIFFLQKKKKKNWKITFKFLINKALEIDMVGKPSSLTVQRITACVSPANVQLLHR